MRNIMLDLETADTGSNAAILSIGAVEFDIKTGEILEKFEQNVYVASSFNSGGTVSQSTLDWWERQPKQAQNRLQHDRASLQAALFLFSEAFTGDWRNVAVWGNGSDFDNVILRNSYHRLGLKEPWGYKFNRCYRTISSLAPHINFERKGIYHCAVDDAQSQAEHLVKVIRSLKYEVEINGCV